MNETSNYKLQLPADNDTANIAVLNGNFGKIDTVMAEKADLDGTGKVPVEQLPNVENAREAVEDHNEDPAAHQNIRQTVNEALLAAGNAQSTADAALEAITQIAHTINVVPTQNGALTYTGGAQSPAWNSYDTEAMTIGGVITETNAGTYTATFTPKEGYTWGDGGAEAKSVTWIIGRADIAAVPVQSGGLTYTGGVQSPTWSNYNPETMTLGGVTTGINAGTYTATFAPTANYQWGDGSNLEKSVNWTIGRATVGIIPTQGGALTYTGGAQSPTWSNYNSAMLTIGGVSSAINAGTYAAAFTPTANAQWSDGSTAAKSANWSIGKAAGSLSLDRYTVTLTTGALTTPISVTRAGDGAISVVSSNPSVATVSVSGAFVVVTGVTFGTASITISVAEGSNHTAVANAVCNVAANIYNAILGNNSWAAISSASASGLAPSLWSVGDGKNININGPVVNCTFSGVFLDVFIIGFNHNANREGANLIHFQIGKLNGQLVALCDNNYGDYGSQGFCMNYEDKNTGGWNESIMRKNILGNDSTPDSPRPGRLLSALPSDLRSVIKGITKYTDNAGSAGGGAAKSITATTDYLFLLAEYEYFGEINSANENEKYYQAQYDYYKAGNSKGHGRHFNALFAAKALCRSPRWQLTYYFCAAETGGTSGQESACCPCGIAPGFCV